MTLPIDQQIDRQIELLGRRCERILSVDELRRKFARSAATGKPLRIKLGMDPPAPDVTLGHAAPLSVIRQFQEWGHKAVLIIGDYTARVGDPSGREKTRPILSGQEIDANARTYVAQVGKLLLTDAEHLEVRWNGEWLAKMDLVQLIRLSGRMTVGQMLERDSFSKRFKEGTPISIHEFIYPLLQGWDSVMIEADVEMGGSDQLFNNLVGREFQRQEGTEGQIVIVTPLLVGLDGVKKMSKSLKNYIAVTDPPSGADGMFGKVMSLPDSAMEMYYTLLTDAPKEEFTALIQARPRDAKIQLAKTIIARFHDQPAAAAAEAAFIQQFVNKHAPTEMPEFQVGPGPHQLAPLIVQAKLAASNGEAIRKMKEGAVYLDGQQIKDFHKTYAVQKPTELKLGRRYARLLP